MWQANGMRTSLQENVCTDFIYLIPRLCSSHTFAFSDVDRAMEITNARSAVNAFSSVGTYAPVCAISQRNAVRAKRNVLRDVLIHDVQKSAVPR
jgi:hypothetical protein